jgi:hypothetical protein
LKSEDIRGCAAYGAGIVVLDPFFDTRSTEYMIARPYCPRIDKRFGTDIALEFNIDGVFIHILEAMQTLAV